MRKRTDDVLVRYEREWRQSQKKKLTLRKALDYVKQHRMPQPAWLHKAIFDLGLAQLPTGEKQGRQANLLEDAGLYEMVEDFRNAGLSDIKACKQTALHYDGEARSWYAVRSAWLRHKEKIKPDPTPFDPEHPWRIKKKHWKEFSSHKKNQETLEAMRNSTPFDGCEALTLEEEEALDNMGVPDYVNEFFRLFRTRKLRQTLIPVALKNVRTKNK